MNKRIDQYTTIDAAPALLIPVWDPASDSTKTVTVESLTSDYATSSTSGLVILSTSGELIAGTNSTKAVTPEGLNIFTTRKYVGYTSSDQTLNQLSGEITIAGFSVNQDQVVEVQIANNLIADGDFVPVTIQTVSIGLDKVLLTGTYTTSGVIHVGIYGIAIYNGVLKIKFKKA